MEKNDRENMDVEKRENRAVTESLTRIKGKPFVNARFFVFRGILQG